MTAPTLTTPQEQYDTLIRLVLRLGAFLASPSAQHIPRAEWQTQFAEYQALNHELNALAPAGLRHYDESDPEA